MTTKKDKETKEECSVMSDGQPCVEDHEGFCSFCGRPMANKLPNKEECECKGIVMCRKHADEFMIKHPPTHSPNRSPSDKTWRVYFREKFGQFYVQKYKDKETVIDFEGVPLDGIASGDIEDFIQDLLTSATIKAKEDERKRLMEKVHDTLWNKDGSLKYWNISDIVSKTMHQFYSDESDSNLTKE